MNWQAKSIVGFLLAIIILASCEAPKEIGLPPSALVNVKYTDTLTIRTSTVLLDSVRTSGAVQLLVGRAKDPVFGQIQANTYFEIRQPSLPFQIKEGTVYEYDSATLSINFTYAYGDTLSNFKFDVHRLTDTLTNNTYYNNNSAPFVATPMVSGNIIPFLNLNNLVTVRLPDSFGKDIFSLNGSEEGKTFSGFTRKVKGLTIRNAATNTCVLGTGPNNIRVNIYYHEKDKTDVLGFSCPVTTRRFNQVQANRQGTNLATLQPLKAQLPNALKNLTYIQEALGIVTKIEIPYFANLMKNNKIAINRAEMTLMPETETAVGKFDLPAALTMAETDESNRVLRDKNDQEYLLQDDLYTFSGLQSPQTAAYDLKFKNYNFVLTTHLQAMVTGYKKTKGFLLMPINYAQWRGYVSANGVPAHYAPFFHNQLQRMTLKPTAENLKLRIFYTETK
jgi:Domain of unknown function (DUF4270)